MKMLGRNFETEKRVRWLVSAVVSALILLSPGSTVVASETKGANQPGAITAMGPGQDSNYLVNYSTDDLTGISIAGQEVDLSKTPMRLPSDTATTLKLACEFGGHDDSKTAKKPDPNSGDPCDHQDQTAKIFEAAGKAMGIPGAYLMCGMVDGAKLDSDGATTAMNEMQKNKLMNYKEAWKAYQRKMNPGKDDSSIKSDSTLTKDTLTSNKPEDFEARIFGLALAYRCTLQPSSDSQVPGPDISTIKGSAGSVEIMNYMINAQRYGIKSAMDDLKAAGAKKTDGHTSIERCIAKINGIPIDDKKQ